MSLIVVHLTDEWHFFENQAFFEISSVIRQIWTRMFFHSSYSTNSPRVFPEGLDRVVEFVCQTLSLQLACLRLQNKAQFILTVWRKKKRTILVILVDFMQEPCKNVTWRHLSKCYFDGVNKYVRWRHPHSIQLWRHLHIPEWRHQSFKIINKHKNRHILSCLLYKTNTNRFITPTRQLSLTLSLAFSIYILLNGSQNDLLHMQRQHQNTPKEKSWPSSLYHIQF